ncbi:hypothetical protein JOB18_002923 [Solea senegalensis]|uniref:Uncharacterized protein n=1 Tax=Solea senegalensis TaxID=28829 RepID=A0AAV6R616_SOLSE|nr:hypothetical protein JOB18_002923 [Solea senegalensis]
MFDQSDTEVDGEVFEEIVKESPGTFKVMLSKEELDASLSSSSCSAAMPHYFEAKALIEKILTTKPGGEKIMQEYAKTKSLKDATRRQMINILTAEMTQTHGAEERGVSVSKSPKIGGPSRVQPRPFTADKVLSDEDVEAAIAVLKHSADEDTIREKMKATFIYHQSMVNNEKRAGDVFSVFPRLLDTPGLLSC